MPARLLVSIGAEGGSIALYGDPAPGSVRYRLVVTDHTPTFLDESERGSNLPEGQRLAFRLANAIAALDRYPWPDLVPLEVDPTIRSVVWGAVQEFGNRTNRSIPESRLSRWREACRVKE